MVSPSINIGILTAAEDLIITHEEVENIIMQAFRAAVAGGILVYMVYAFAKGIGMSKKEQLKYAEMAREI